MSNHGEPEVTESCHLIITATQHQAVCASIILDETCSKQQPFFYFYFRFSHSGEHDQDAPFLGGKNACLVWIGGQNEEE